MSESSYKYRHTGRLGQIGICLGKLFRMFVYQNDWKVVLMAAVITSVVGLVMRANMNISMEGTAMGSFAFVCVFIWNGFFNSIQVICRERPIVKREHRSGLHMSSYIIAHMIYQGFLCILQTIVALLVMRYVGIKIPEEGVLMVNPYFDYFITIFLITFAADMVALFVSSLAKNSTLAMTIVPFLMIFHLVFSGSFFNLTGVAQKACDYSISKWGVNSMCAIGEYNNLPMTSIWTAMRKMQGMSLQDFDVATYSPDAAELAEMSGAANKTIGDLLNEIESSGHKQDLLLRCGQQNQSEMYASTAENLLGCWVILDIYGLVFALAAMISLEFIDLDKR